MKRMTEKIRLRLSREELEYLKECSGSFSELRFKNGGENFSAFLREKLLTDSGYGNQNLERRLKEVQYELRKIGTNINQVTRKINGEFGTANDIAELKKYLNGIEEIVTELNEEVKKSSNH